MSKLPNVLKQTIGFIGTGVMGYSMCSHLINAGYNMNVYNRTQSKCDGLVELGASWMDSPFDLAQNSDIIISIVGYPHDVDEVILDEDFGALAGLSENNILIDMTTSSPSQAECIAAKCEDSSVHFIDAPVSGGDIGAKNATLTIFCGGDSEIVDYVTPIFMEMGKKINFMGPAGSGQHCKVSNQLFIAAGMIGVCEGLLYAEEAGLDVPSVIEACESGAAGSWSLSNYGPRILRQDYDPGFFVKHFIKDLGIALDSAEEMGLVFPGTNLAKQLYETMATYDEDELGTQSLILALQRLSNKKLKKYDI